MQLYAKEIFSCACPFTDASERFQTGRRRVYDRREAGFHWRHTYLREAKTVSKLLQIGPREFQQRFIFAQKSRTLTQLHITCVSLSSSHGPWHSNPGDVLDGQWEGKAGTLRAFKEESKFSVSWVPWKAVLSSSRRHRREATALHFLFQVSGCRLDRARPQS